MSNHDRLMKSIREVTRSVSVLERKVNNLSHPSVEHIVEYEESLAKIAEYSGKVSVKKRSELIFGKMTDRMNDMTNGLEKLESMLLEISRKVKND